MLSATCFALTLCTSSAVAAPRAKASARAVQQQSTPPNALDAGSRAVSAVQLLDRTKTDPVVVMAVSDNDIEIDIQGPENNPLSFRVTQETSKQAWTITDGTRKISPAFPGTATNWSCHGQPGAARRRMLAERRSESHRRSTNNTYCAFELKKSLTRRLLTCRQPNRSLRMWFRCGVCLTNL